MKYPRNKKRLQELAGVNEAPEKWVPILSGPGGKMHPKFKKGVKVVGIRGMGQSSYTGVVTKVNKDGTFEMKQDKDSGIMAGWVRQPIAPRSGRWNFQVK